MSVVIGSTGSRLWDSWKMGKLSTLFVMLPLAVIAVPDNMVPGVLTSFLIPQIIPVLSETV